MTILQIQKKALKCNKAKYTKALTIPLITLILTVLLTTAPHIIALLVNYINSVTAENYNVILSVCESVSALSICFVSFMLYSSVSLGEQAFYGGRMRKKQNSFKRFLFWFKPKKSFKAFKTKALVFFLKLFWSIVFLLPFFATVTFILAVAFSGGIEVYLLLSLSCGALVLLAVGLIFRFIIIQRYFLSEYLLSENPSLTPLQCITQSKNLLDGHIFRIIKFKLSFLPLFISCALIIPAVFVYPHYKQSRTIVANELMI